MILCKHKKRVNIWRPKQTDVSRRETNPRGIEYLVLDVVSRLSYTPIFLAGVGFKLKLPAAPPHRRTPTLSCWAAPPLHHDTRPVT